MPLKLYPFDMADYLKTPEQVEVYLQVVLEENDPELFQESLGIVARSKGMQAIARQSKTTRAGLYKALSAAGNPEFATVVRVVEALGYSFAIHRKRPKKTTKKATARPAKKTAKKSASRALAAKRRRA
ncbi:MAG TPA: addiction module antidote protein [Rudaea sp.]|jgi:probable addiction module antidote protein|nr:addiction module antidote protein [Rudaea sp.]